LRFLSSDKSPYSERVRESVDLTESLLIRASDYNQLYSSKNWSNDLVGYGYYINNFIMRAVLLRSPWWKFEHFCDLIYPDMR